MKKLYKNFEIDVEDEETQYFMTQYSKTREEAKILAEKELLETPILNRYEIVENTTNYKIKYFFNKPLIQYFDYGIDKEKAQKYIEEFLLNSDKPIANYACNSSDFGMMYASLIGALDTVGALQETRDKVEEVYKKRASLTKTTNWCGD